MPGNLVHWDLELFAIERQDHPVVGNALSVQPRGAACFFHALDGAAFEHARPDAFQHPRPRGPLDDQAVDPRLMQQLAEQQT